MGNGIHRPQNQITEPTRRNIADELRLRNLDPSGRLDEVALLSRMFDLKSLPTTDYRTHEFTDMAADVWQHRVRGLTPVFGIGKVVLDRGWIPTSFDALGCGPYA